MVSLDQWKKDKADGHKHRQAEKRAQLAPSGLTETEKAKLVDAVEAPLMAYHAGRDFLFVADDAETAAGVLGDKASATGYQVDARDWNQVLDQLAAAGHVVYLTEPDAAPPGE